jgi:hypothetical protein
MGVAADGCFAQPGLGEPTIGKATKHSSDPRRLRLRMIGLIDRGARVSRRATSASLICHLSRIPAGS